MTNDRTSDKKYCSSCGKKVKQEAEICPHCGVRLKEPFNSKKLAAGLLGILLGSLGAHKFYLGETGIGVLYLCFFWTGIPGIVGLIEGILYLVSSDKEYEEKYL